MKLRRYAILIIIPLAAINALCAAYMKISHYTYYGHWAPIGLHADVITRHVSIGIPGISKMYEGVITNLGILPVRVTRCDFIDDTNSRGSMVAYSVERKVQRTNQWQAVLPFDASDFCKPYPLGIAQATLNEVWLWPGQNVGTGEEATAASNSLKLGDSVRFLIHARLSPGTPRLIPTPEFLIDEQIQEPSDIFRLRH